MAISKNIIKGVSIRTIAGGHFNEMKMLRQTISLLISNLDYESLTTEEKLVYDEFQTYDDRVNEIINQ